MLCTPALMVHMCPCSQEFTAYNAYNENNINLADVTWSAVSSCLRSVPAAAASVASLKSSAACRRLSSCIFSCGTLAQPCHKATQF